MTTSAADLELRVSTTETASGTVLRYTLHSAPGVVPYTYHQIDGEVALRARPEEYQARVFRTLHELEKGLGSDGSLLLGEDIRRELTALGHELYRELFPRQLRSAYGDVRERIKTLLIVSDEPWIPWELIKPYEAAFEDDFLCCQFELTRWLAGETAPAAGFGAAEIGVARLVCFEVGRPPAAVPLPQAEDEARLLAELAGRHGGVESQVVASATYEQVEKLLRLGGHGVLHFVGHSEFEPAEPNVSRFLLADGRSFRPRDLLHGGIEARIRQDRPLVFFNSCQAGQQGFSLSRLGGWTSRWILDCGCGAFVGPQWSVSDSLASLFAEVFYGALEQGSTVARAALEARRQVRKQAPASTAWLAYSVYAHSNARLRLGLGPVPLRIPESRWHPEISPPGALLRAEYGIVEFHGRDEELRNLLEWSVSDAPVQVRLYTGAGGMGKTRLAIELCRNLREKGWQAGFLAPDPAREPIDLWRDLIARDKPSLIVVDYSESRRGLLIQLLQQMSLFKGGKIRVLLLSRAALDWWERLKREGEGVGELLSGPATRWLRLKPLAFTAEERQKSYLRAVEAFCLRLGKPAPPALPGDLGEACYERVLLLHMRALADIEGEAEARNEDGVLDYVLWRERRFWRRLAVERDLPESLADGIGRAMALITLGGGVASEDHAVRVLQSLRFFADQERSTLVQVARLLRASYPGERWIEPILPDLLGEHLVQREMELDSEELLGRALGPRSPLGSL